jgi:hypothetical protein
VKLALYLVGLPALAYCLIVYGLHIHEEGARQVVATLASLGGVMLAVNRLG